MIRAQLSPGSLARTTNRLDKIGKKVNVALYRGVEREAINLTAHIKAYKLSDQVIHVRTGRLRRSITYRMSTHGNTVISKIGTNVKYARPLEFGFTGSVMVRAHVRRMKMAFGKKMRNPRSVNVRAHAMQMNLKARPFMRPSLQENQKRITTNLRAIIAKEMKTTR